MILIIRVKIVKLIQKQYKDSLFKKHNFISSYDNPEVSGELHILIVRTRRFELPHPKRILAPQASASTNSATCAFRSISKLKKLSQNA